MKSKTMNNSIDINAHIDKADYSSEHKAWQQRIEKEMFNQN